MLQFVEWSRWQRPAIWRTRSLPVSLLFSLAVLVCGCSKSAPVQKDAKVPTVICVVATGETITDYDEFIGRTEAAHSVDVQARVSGVLEEVAFVDGQRVKVGQLLATIEKDEYQAVHAQSLARVELAKARLELAKSELARAEKLIKGSAISKEEYDQKSSTVTQASAEVVVAEADADRSALDLKYTNINAAIAGRIDRAFVTEGNMLTGGLGAGTQLTRIVASSPMYAYFNADEKALLRYIRIGQSRSTSGSDVTTGASLKDLAVVCELQLQDEKDFPHRGVLDFVETGVDTDTGTIELRGVFDNDHYLIQDGMFVRVRIPAGDPYKAVMIPEIAIGTDQSYKFAFVVDADGKAERRTVELGRLYGSRRVILNGVQVGETVIARGVQRVRPGMAVQVEMEAEPTGSSGKESSATETTGQTDNAGDRAAGPTPADDQAAGGQAGSPSEAQDAADRTGAAR